MNRSRIVMATAGLVLAATGAWLWLRPIAPVNTPHFEWQKGESARYELVVREVAGNPEFRVGVTTPPVPQSGTLRVSGTAAPGALVEVSNPRTGRGYATVADASGAFAVEAQARRGDELKVLSRKVELRNVAMPKASAHRE